MSINYGQVNRKLKQLIGDKKYVPGQYYRATTLDRDTFEGILTFVNDTTIELQLGDSFKSFNRGTTSFVKLPSLDCP